MFNQAGLGMPKSVFKCSNVFNYHRQLIQGFKVFDQQLSADKKVNGSVIDYTYLRVTMHSNFQIDHSKPKHRLEFFNLSHKKNILCAFEST